MSVIKRCVELPDEIKAKTEALFVLAEKALRAFPDGYAGILMEEDVGLMCGPPEKVALVLDADYQKQAEMVRQHHGAGIMIVLIYKDGSVLTSILLSHGENN